MLTELKTQDRTLAHDSFVMAAWQGAEGPELLSLAEAAGLNAQDADTLIERIRQGKKLAETAHRLPRLRKDAAEAMARFEKVESRAKAEIARLQDGAERAAFKSRAARSAVNAAEDAARQLLMLHDDGLLPVTEAPKDVFQLIRRREAEEKFRQADHARWAAAEQQEHASIVVRNLENQLAKMPLTITSEQDEARLKRRIEEAKRRLDDAEKCRKKAQAASDAAKKAIP